MNIDDCKVACKGKPWQAISHAAVSDGTAGYPTHMVAAVIKCVFSQQLSTRTQENAGIEVINQASAILVAPSLILDRKTVRMEIMTSPTSGKRNA